MPLLSTTLIDIKTKSFPSDLISFLSSVIFILAGLPAGGKIYNLTFSFMTA
jgi:hypothetical protein